MGILDKFSKNAETSDKQQDPNLRTHYYKATAQQSAQAIQHLAHAKQWKIILENSEYQEYTLQTNDGAEAIINLYNVSILETAVDVYVNSNKMFGHSAKVIQEIYHYLNQHLTQTNR